MEIKQDIAFATVGNDPKSEVFEVIPNLFKDNRGSFSEVLKDLGGWSENCGYPLWFSTLDWIRQINRSKSQSLVVRGLHAQSGIYCQAKLVEAVNRKIYDIIIDARPQSSTFGASNVYLLDPEKQNKIFVPRGFLHGFIVPEEYASHLVYEDAIFNYYCDNTYNKESEICINPMSAIPTIIEELKRLCKDDMKSYNKYLPIFTSFEQRKFIYSDKDINGESYDKFMIRIKEEYEKTGRTWYKQS